MEVLGVSRQSASSFSYTAFYGRGYRLCLLYNLCIRAVEPYHVFDLVHRDMLILISINIVFRIKAVC